MSHDTFECYLLGGTLLDEKAFNMKLNSSTLSEDLRSRYSRSIVGTRITRRIEDSRGFLICMAFQVKILCNYAVN